MDAIKRKEEEGVLGVIGMKVGGKMRGVKEGEEGMRRWRRRREEERRRREEEGRRGMDGRRRLGRGGGRGEGGGGKIERKAVNMNGLERYAILSTGTAVCVPDN